MYRILLADDEGIMLESLKKIIETGIFAGYLFYGYPDAGNKWDTGNQGNSEI